MKWSVTWSRGDRSTKNYSVLFNQILRYAITVHDDNFSRRLGWSWDFTTESLSYPKLQIRRSCKFGADAAKAQTETPWTHAPESVTYCTRYCHLNTLSLTR